MARNERISITRRQLVRGVGVAGAALVGMGLAACSGGASSSSAAAASKSSSAASAGTSATSTSVSASASQPAAIAGRNLVAFFSRAGENYNVGVVEEGNTAKVAFTIAGKVVATVFEITPAEPYPESYDETLTRAQQELDSNARPALAENIGNLDEYGTIYLGFPTWHGHLPRIVLTFLESHNWSGKKIMPFNTSGSSGFGSCLSDLKAACAGAEIAEGLSIAGTTAQNDPAATEKAVNDWLAKVRK